VAVRFQSAMAAALSAGIATLNSQAIIPTMTDGFRTAADQTVRRNDPNSITPAKISPHQGGIAADFRYGPSLVKAFTGAGLTWGGAFSHPDVVHYQLAPVATAAVMQACGGQ